MKELPQKYDHRETEKRWQNHWFSAGTYHWQNDAPRERTYVIDTPPPTVSGLLHMGHVFSYVQADIVARYQRMKGMDVFYPMGFDDNGLPTERLVEKTRKKRASDYDSREDFIKVCEEVSEEARQDFRDLFKSIALSVDWRQEYHTISEHCRRLSQHSFLDLYTKGHIERRLEPMLWDPVDQTAIAQAEIVDKELDSHFSDIRFRVMSSCDSSTAKAQDPDSAQSLRDSQNDEFLIISTTRPELIPACVGIFYHPEDARYQHLKGKKALTPLFNVPVPILEDDTVEMEKGTGIMMCCTFGDEADIEKWRKHHLPTRVIINSYGKIDLNLPLQPTEADPFGEGCFAPGFQWQESHLEKLQNKKVSNADAKHPGARQIILEMLRESGDLIESKPIKHAVKCAERSGAPLEILPTHQWFVKVTDKKEALKARAAESNWHPEWMRLRMEQWIDGLNWDWCISRQRYYGVPFPVWYSKRAGEEGKVILPSPDQLPVNPLTDLPAGYSKDEVTPDADVMDTWATSSISPQISAGSISESLIVDRESPQSQSTNYDSRFTKLFPADLRPQAHEIIRTWAFYTVVKAHLHSDCVPWYNLMISGWCLAEDKTKMSKSKGNVVTPVELIEEQGTDAVRYWASTSRLGQDTAFSKDLLKIGKKLVTKLWNATKFAAIHLEKLPSSCDSSETKAQDPDSAPSLRDSQNDITETLDRWILTRLHRATAKATEAFEKYEYADALRATEDFFWNDFCDNYLELVKKRVYGGEDHSHEPAKAVDPSDRSGTDRQIVGEKLQEAEAGDNTKTLSAVLTIDQCLRGILKLFAPFVPHITEELYSHLFVVDYEAYGSLHARGQWPEAASYLKDENAEAAGIAAVEMLEVIRKAKSERGVSIKFPITYATLYAKDAPDLSGVLDDLCAAGNIESLERVESAPSDALISESGRFALTLTFAESAEVA